MEITKNFPFPHCETCPECVLDVNEKRLYSSGNYEFRELIVGCKNAQLCQRLEEQRNARDED